MVGRRLFPLVFFVTLFIAAPIAAASAPQDQPRVGFAEFHDRLATSGSWAHNARWGDVWRPNGVSRSFRPYFDGGHWVYTDYGWYWAGDYDWGDIVYHYGRWVFDPEMGWVWIPGYIWAPAWVYWRFGGGFVGWMPTPPDAYFLAGIGIGLAFADWGPSFFGYRDWYGGLVGPGDLWVFVGGNHFAEVNFQRFAVPRAQAASFIARTRNVTRFTTVRGVVANRSISSRSIARLSGRPIRAVPARSLARGNIGMTRASVGRTVAARERIAHPIAMHIAVPHRVVSRRTVHVARAARHAHVVSYARHPISGRRVYTHHVFATRHAYGRRPTFGHFAAGQSTHPPAPATHGPVGHPGGPGSAPQTRPGGGKRPH